MSGLYDNRRYLTNFDSRRTGNILADILVIGGGIAGARAAIEAARHTNNVLLLCKHAFEESTTRYAQGGIASAYSSEDSPESHFEDTLRVGRGLGHRDVIELVVREGPRRIEELISWGMRFDMKDGRVALGREGGHSVARILHHAGDATGRELSRALCAKVRDDARIRVFENSFLIDLITDQGRCLGAVVFHEKYGHQLIWSKQTILATGGCGRVYRETTNPELATGDGYAAAYRAGAVLADMEMVQFHPTTLYVAGASRVLISEAVRGEGALLLDRSGERFMPEYHSDAELAPRDVVSRAIIQRMRQTRSNCVYLSVRHLGKERFEKRFPSIAKLCADFQIDVSRDLIPVRPAAHYMIGGAVTDLAARTNLEGLLCCGEAACTGLHGANRLASNSLLEGLVLGAIAGETAGRHVQDDPSAPHAGYLSSENQLSHRTELDVPDIRNSLRSLMWRNAGIERNGDHLAEAAEIIDFWGQYVMDKTFDSRSGWEVQNMLSVGRLIVTAARERDHSLGVHHRTDDDATGADEPIYHLLLERTADGSALRRVGVDLKGAV